MGSVPPALQNRLLLTLLAKALIADALAHSLEPNVAGYVYVTIEQVGDEVCLVVEDDGWMRRSQEKWANHNRVARELVRSGGGRLRREVEWACNRTVVVLPAQASR